MSSIGRLGSVAMVTASVAAAAALSFTPVAPARRLDCSPTWQELQPAAVADGELVSVAAAAVNDVWAVGASPASFIAGPTVARRSFIEHWDGSAWTVVPGLSLHATLRDVTAVRTWTHSQRHAACLPRRPHDG